MLVLLFYFLFFNLSLAYFPVPFGITKIDRFIFTCAETYTVLVIEMKVCSEPMTRGMTGPGM